MVPMSDGRYARDFVAGWATMDFNGHMGNSAYLDLAADVRMAFFAEHGFPPAEFRRLAIGPVIQREEMEYFREVSLFDTVTVTYAVVAMSAEGDRFVVENEIWLGGGRAARVRSTGGWLDLRARKLVAPPAALLAAFSQVPRVEDFVELVPREGPGSATGGSSPLAARPASAAETAATERRYLRVSIARWNIDLDSPEAERMFRQIDTDGVSVFRTQPGFVRYRLMRADAATTIAVAEWESEELGRAGAERYRAWMRSAGIMDRLTLETYAGDIVAAS